MEVAWGANGCSVFCPRWCQVAAAHELVAQLDANRKLAVINGMGEFNRAQGNSSAVKEALSASLVAAKAPFRLVQDHSRSGRLEAATPALRKWLLSDAFHWCARAAPVARALPSGCNIQRGHGTRCGQ